MTMMLLWSADKAVSHDNNVSCVIECFMLCRCTFTHVGQAHAKLEFS